MRRYRYRCTVCRTTSPVVHQFHDLAAEGTAHRQAIHAGHIPDRGSRHIHGRPTLPNQPARRRDSPMSDDLQEQLRKAAEEQQRADAALAEEIARAAARDGG
ncbi:hypothetical protein ACIRQO_36130 [Streptomyces anulatus]